MNILRLFLCGLSLLVCQGLRAQVVNFSGGTGQGYTQKVSILCRLSGSSDIYGFTGGNGAGSIAASRQYFMLDGSTPGVNFSGGIDDGAAVASLYNYSLGGVLQNLLYVGGPGSGSISRKSPISSLSGFSNENLLFYGGYGMGSTAKSGPQSLLNGSTVTLVFTGGAGIGSVVKLSRLVQLSGSDYVQFFPGGNGRGNIVLKSPTLSLSGAASQGFARIAQSTISDFRALPQYNRVKLHWKTENPEGIDHFKVQKSVDGVEFTPVGLVSSSFHSGSDAFTFLHSEENTGEGYFRLVQVFKDSSQSYSAVIKAAFNPEKELFSIYPNPVADVLHLLISNPDQSNEVLIYNHSGNLVRQMHTSGKPTLDLETNDLAPGLYWIELKTEQVKNRIRFTRL